MVETMRYADPGDCEEMAHAQEAFFTELSKYLSVSRSLSKNQDGLSHIKIKDSVFLFHKNNYHCTELLLKRFYLNGHTLGVYPRTPQKKVQPFCKPR